MTKSPLGRKLRFLASLKLAVLVLLGLAIALAVGTVLESAYDTPTAQYHVYRALWFKGLLILLGINIAAVMVDRWPWKPRHAPFLLAHIGILILLSGSWLTDRFGLDGMMRVSEGESSSSVELDSPILVASTSKEVRTVSLPWQPPHTRFRSVSLRDLGLPFDVTVDRFFSHAEAVYEFFPAEVKASAHAAIQVRLSGGPMRVRQDFWLWAGQPEWSGFQFGPAWFGIKTLEGPRDPQVGPRILFEPSRDGGVNYIAHGSSGEVLKGKLPAGTIEGANVPVPWKGGVQLSVLRWIPAARLESSYKPSRVQYRDMAPPPAIRLTAGRPDADAHAWLGMGDRVQLTVDGEKVEFGYYRRRVLLPISLRLDRFQIDRYEGSMRPKSYASQVTLLNGAVPEKDQKRFLISMNEPLEVGGVTFYQASYEDAMPRPVTSIFSVNRDPGRSAKYIGSLLIVLGSILLFAMKYRKRKVSA